MSRQSTSPHTPQQTSLNENIVTVSAPVTSSLADCLRQANIDPKPLFEQARIDLGCINDPYRMISLDHYTHLLELSAKVIKRPLLGLELGCKQNPAKWGAFGYVVLNSPSVGTALANMAHFIKASQGGTVMNFVNREDAFGIEYSITHPSIRYREQDAEFAIGYVKHVVDQLCGTRTPPQKVLIEHPALDEPSAYKKLLDTSPYFEQGTNVILFEKALQKRPVLSADLQLFPILKKHLSDLVNSSNQNMELTENIAFLIRQHLPGGQCRQEIIAKTLATTPRTLQRKLKALGTSFGELLDNTRKDMALHYVADRSLEIKEVAYLLGFTDSSAFIKAFRKWTGCTPGQYQKR